MKSKIFVIYHKLENPIISDIFQPLAVGCKDHEDNRFLYDNVGKNISEKNTIYNEMTGIYWVFSHLDEFKNIEYIGFSHYRRFFCFDGLDKTSYVKKHFEQSLCEPKPNQLEKIFSDYDFIAPRASHYRSVEKHYKKTHNKEDLNILRKIIKEKCPEYSKDAEEYLGSSKEFLYNMFVFKKEDFIKYSNFIFAVLEEFEKHKTSNERLYVSERLTGIFITHLLNEGKQALFLPVLHIRSKSFKSARKQVKINFKEKKDRGFVYKIKPLILYFLPRCLEQHFRRRKTR